MAVTPSSIVVTSGGLTQDASTLAGRGDSGSGPTQQLTLGSGLAISGTTVSSTATGGMPLGYISGLELSNNATDAVNDIDIAAGACRSGANTDDIVLASVLVKRLDAAWAVGTNQGGLDTGSKASSTWYHLWAIKRSDTSVVDVLFSASATAPTMPTNYDRKRRIGAVLTDGSGNLIAFIQRGDRIAWSVPRQDVNANNPGTSATLRALSVPTGVRVQANMQIIVLDTTYVSGTDCLVTDPACADTTPTYFEQTVRVVSNGSYTSPAVQAVTHIGTNTSAQVRTRLNQSTADHYLRISTYGWIDPRA